MACFKARFGIRLGLLIIVTVSCCVFVAILNFNLANQLFVMSLPRTVPDPLSPFKYNNISRDRHTIFDLVNESLKINGEIYRNMTSSRSNWTMTTRSYLNYFFIHREWLRDSLKANTMNNVSEEKTKSNPYLKVNPLHLKNGTNLLHRMDTPHTHNETNYTDGQVIEYNRQKESFVNKMFRLMQNVSVEKEKDVKGNSLNDYFNEEDLFSQSPFDDTDEVQRKAASYSFRKHIYQQFYRKIINQGGVDCPSIIQGDLSEMERARRVMLHHTRNAVPIEKYGRITNCNNFIRTRGYINDPLSDTEKNFPLAFSLIVYRDVEQVERLLRAIYRPQNFYCIHVDTEMNQKEEKALYTIAGCFDNVFIASRSINVTWGEYTVLEAELICMKDLLQKKGWKYFINLTGQEYPLKTNREIVEILMAMDGENIVDGAMIRASQKYFYRWTNTGGPPPRSIRPFKGAVHVAVNRGFVDFCLNNQTALDLLSWLKKTDISDESFFASLNYNAHLKAPGGFNGTPEEVPLKPAFTRYKRWRPSNNTGIRECYGKYVHDVCVLGIGDISRAYRNIGLFVNKFYLNYQYLALDCLEEVLYKKTWQEYLYDAQINVTIYKNRDAVTYVLTHTYEN